MSDLDEVGKLKQRIDELEQQLQEEREEFQWDAKAAKETSEKNIHKLAEDLAKAKRESQPGVGPGDGKLREQLEAANQRAILAERRVSELQQEMTRRPASGLTPVSVPKADPSLKQRAESAEMERDSLRKEHRALQRLLEEKESTLQRVKAQAEESRLLKQQLDSMKFDLSNRDRELRQLKESSGSAADRDKELLRLREEVQKKSEEGARIFAQLQEKEKKLQETSQRAASSAGWEGEISRVKDEMARSKVASSQMLEQREREVERLKSDLKHAAAQHAILAEQVAEMRREGERIKQENARLRRERDERGSQLAEFREKEVTQVGRHPDKTDAKLDVFHEDTRPGAVSLELLHQSLDGSPAQASDTPLMVVPTNELSAEQMMQQPVIGAEELFPVESFQDSVKATVREPLVPRSSSMDAKVPLSDPAGGIVSLDSSTEVTEEAAVAGSPLGEDDENDSPVLGRLVPVTPLEPLDQDADAPESTELVRPLRKKRKHLSSPDGTHRKLWRGLIILFLFVLVAGGLVLMAWKYFPVWFGVAEEAKREEPSQVSKGMDAGVGQPQPSESQEPAAIVDAGLARETGTGQDPVQSADGSSMEAPGAGDKAEVGVAEEAPEASLEQKKAQDEAYALLRAKKYPQAEKFLEEVVARHASDPVLHYLYGRILFYQKKYQSAVVELEKAVELDNNMAEAFYELGGVYMTLGDKPQAARALEAFIRLKPTDKRVVSVRTVLKKLQ